MKSSSGLSKRVADKRKYKDEAASESVAVDASGHELPCRFNRISVSFLPFFFLFSIRRQERITLPPGMNDSSRRGGTRRTGGTVTRETRPPDIPPGEFLVFG